MEYGVGFCGEAWLGNRVALEERNHECTPMHTDKTKMGGRRWGRQGRHFGPGLLATPWPAPSLQVLFIVSAFPLRVYSCSFVTAMRKVCVRQRIDSEGRGVAVRVPDHLDVLAELDCGAQAHFRCSEVMGFAEPGSGARLYGSEGTLVFDPGNDRLLGARRGETALQPLTIPPEKRETWRVEAEFIDAIRGVAPVRLTPFAEGVKYMEFTEAVARSDAEGRTINLPLPG